MTQTFDTVSKIEAHTSEAVTGTYRSRERRGTTENYLCFDFTVKLLEIFRDAPIMKFWADTTVFFVVVVYFDFLVSHSPFCAREKYIFNFKNITVLKSVSPSLHYL